MSIPYLEVVRLAPGQRAEAIADAVLGARQGFTTMEPDDLARFAPIESVEVPDGRYVLEDVDTGRDTLNLTPDDALPRIAAEGRSPLTVDEGLALVAQFPELLRTHNAFSLLGSRCGDRRVTAIWVSKGAPRLGWCWAGNPHTWLGSASCARRVAAL
jgi:hypothetical protein